MTTICLSMIVKNEARVIKRCLASVKAYITHWAIVDTGSTDGTQDIIRAELSGIPGQLIERNWEDFATGRNQALELANETGADYAMFIDADEELVWPEGFPMAEKLTAELYGIQLCLPGTDEMWSRTFLIKMSARTWQWVGRVHEYLECPDPPEQVVRAGISGAHIVSYCDGGRNQDDGRRTKFKGDIKQLEKMIKERPTEGRWVFYLAQSLLGLNELDKAYKAYERCAGMGGWEEEGFSCYVHMAIIRHKRGDHIDDVAAAWRRAFEFRPQRAEPLFELCLLYRDLGMHAMAEVYARAALRIKRPPDVLLVNESLYQWRAADELAGALARQGRGEEAKEILTRLVQVKSLPEADRARAIENIEMLNAPPTVPKAA